MALGSVTMQKPNAMMLAMQEVHSLMLEQTAQNLANANNVGFKAFRVKMKEVERQSVEGNIISYVAVDKIQRDHTSGSLTVTNNTYDMAITGPGYFAVQTQQGVRYTRNGQFHLNKEGFLVNLNNEQVLNSDLTPIQIPLLGVLYVSSSGKININNKASGSIGIFEFENEDGLQGAGHNNIKTEEEPKAAQNFFVTQGAVEESNVSLMREAINMITIQRNYEHAQKLIDEYDQQQRKINQINAKNM